jgi:uncharacterized membrane protein
MSADTHADDPLTTEPLHVGAARFSGIDGAERAFAGARDREPGAAWIGDAAFVEVHHSGRIVVRGSVAGHYVDLDGLGDVIGRDTGIGAVVGAAVGLLLGPPAFAVGVVGGATVGGVVEASHISKPEGPAFDAIREQVPEGASAIVVVSDAERARAMTEALAIAAESVEHYPLTPAAEAELRSALAEAPPITPATPATDDGCHQPTET